MAIRKPQVWMSIDALLAHSRLPRSVQEKYSKLIVKLKQDSSRRGLNFESIEGARDRHMKSVRVDDSYRSILYVRDGALVVLWVDEHDKAYRWAQNRTMDVNPQSAAVQIIDVALTQTPPPPPAKGLGLFKRRPKPLFAAISDVDLERLGVPRSALPAVRMMTRDEDLYEARNSLPNDAFDALIGLAAGYSTDQVLADLDRTAAPSLDAADFAAALQTDESRQTFWLVEDDEELLRMLDAPLESWRVFLHPTQRRLVEKNWNGPVLVRGGAGTGKTVVAMHRARHLAQKLIEAGDETGRVLFTTFTSNLAADLRENLRNLCSREALTRIDVANLDAWVAEFLRGRGWSRKVVYSSSAELIPLWNESCDPRTLAALDLDPDVARDEWRHVVQAHGVSNLPDYLAARRPGRPSLDRAARTKLWDIFAEYRAKLAARRLAEPEDAFREAAEILKAQPALSRYRAVVMDEAQDMGPEAFRLAAALVPAVDGQPAPNSLFIVGDAHQRIYGRQAALAECGISIRGRSRALRINYRTTHEIRRWAVALLDGAEADDLDGGADDLKGYRSLYHGPTPELRRCADRAEQTAALLEWIARCRAAGVDDSEIGILGRANWVVEAMEKDLRKASVETVLLEARKSDDRTRPGVRLATMHRAKGLEFGAVAIVDVNDGLIPPRNALDKASAQQEILNAERFLLHVAATRAKKNLFISSSGNWSSLLSKK